MSLINPFAMSGMGDPVVSAENEFQWGPIATWQTLGIVLDVTAVDVGDTPTTTLRRGLALGQVAASGFYKQYSPTATDGTQICRGFLYQPRNMLDPRTGIAAAQQGQLVFFGNVKVGSVFGFDEQARRQLQDVMTFDDFRILFGPPSLVVPTTAAYQVLQTDNNKYFTTDGATGAVPFTLPATIARGSVFRFANTVDQAMSVIAPAGKLIVTNNNTATSVAFQTASQKIGSVVEITVNSDGTKYIANLMTPNTATVA